MKLNLSILKWNWCDAYETLYVKVFSLLQLNKNRRKFTSQFKKKHFIKTRLLKIHLSLVWSCKRCIWMSPVCGISTPPDICAQLAFPQYQCPFFNDLMKELPICKIFFKNQIVLRKHTITEANFVFHFKQCEKRNFAIYCTVYWIQSVSITRIYHFCFFFCECRFPTFKTPLHFSKIGKETILVLFRFQ